MWRRSRTWDPGTWSSRTERPRVLIEDPDGAIRWASKRFLQRQGFDVAVCPGPEAMGARRCPEVSCGTCPLAEGADIIYMNLGWNNPESRDVLQAHRSRYPDTPVVVEITDPNAKRFPDILTGCQRVPAPSGRSTMLGAIRDTLASTSAS